MWIGIHEADVRHQVWALAVQDFEAESGAVTLPRNGAGAMILVQTSARARPGRREELTRACRAMSDASASDEGVLAYTFTSDLDDPDLIYGLELWQSQDALDAHMKHTHTAQFLGGVGDLVAGPPDMTFTELST